MNIHNLMEYAIISCVHWLLKGEFILGDVMITMHACIAGSGVLFSPLCVCVCVIFTKLEVSLQLINFRC